ncbi:MAG TPA: tyrosine--tRNA ligase [Patescibacteria group bacterium]|nr:tyrosine--tRNA ligase [Patescibacteria group bacterium]
MDKIEEILLRGVANIIPSKEDLRKTLNGNKKLNIYLGIDPTSTKIHLGHTVPLRKLKAFSDLGHNVTFLIGDFTALIGDTSDKESERPALTQEEINENFKTYKKQAEKILDFSKVKVRHNSEWLKKLSFEDIVRLTQNFSVGDFIGRELVKKRLGQGKRVGLHEFLYPVMQGYDSFIMNTDIQVGGTDQTFNMQAGRTLIKNLSNKNSFVLTTPILEGLDGRKMSKSWGNAIWIDDSPYDIFAKVMAVNDDLIGQYFTLVTSFPMDEVKKIEESVKKEPMKAKKKLAYVIVSELYSKKEADKAEEQFQNTVQKKELPDQIETVSIKDLKETIFDTVSDWVKLSRSETKRLIQQKGVRVNDKTINAKDAEQDIKEGMVIRIGKRKIVKISP